MEDVASRLKSKLRHAIGLTHHQFIPDGVRSENLDPSQWHDAFPADPKMHAAAGEAIAGAFSELQREGFRSLNTPSFDRF